MLHFEIRRLEGERWPHDRQITLLNEDLSDARQGWRHQIQVTQIYSGIRD